MTWQIDYSGSWQSRVWLEPKLCFIVHPRQWSGETEQKRGRGDANREGGRLTSFFSYFARTWTSFFTLTFVCSSRNTIQEEFFPKECDKLREREREAGREKDRDRGQIRTPPYTKLSKNYSSRDSNRATGLSQIKAAQTFPKGKSTKTCCHLNLCETTKLAWIISNLPKPAAVYCHSHCCCCFSMLNPSQSHTSGPQSQGLLTKAAGGGYSSLPRFLIRSEGTRPVGGSERNTHKLRDDFRQHHYSTTLTEVWAVVQWTKKVIRDQIYCCTFVLCCTLNASVKDLLPFMNLPPFAQRVTDVSH